MKSKKEIVISPTRVVTALIVFLMLVTASFVFIPRIPALFTKEYTGMTAEGAARAGAEEFFSVDAKASKDAWINQVCLVSTTAGCKMIEKIYAPMLWPSIEKKGLRFACKTISASQIQSGVSDAAIELWELKTVCTNLDTGETNNNITQVIVSSSTGAGWKFERIRFDQEIKQ
jgi:hypothetical protein